MTVVILVRSALNADRPARSAREVIVLAVGDETDRVSLWVFVPSQAASAPDGGLIGEQRTDVADPPDATSGTTRRLRRVLLDAIRIVIPIELFRHLQFDIQLLLTEFVGFVIRHPNVAVALEGIG